MSNSDSDSDFEDQQFSTPARMIDKRKKLPGSEISSYSNSGSSQDSGDKEHPAKKLKHTWKTVSLNADTNMLFEMKSKFSYKYLEHKSEEEEKKVFRYHDISISILYCRIGVTLLSLFRYYRCKEKSCGCKIRIINKKTEGTFSIFMSGEHSHESFSKRVRGLDLDTRTKLMPLMAGNITTTLLSYTIPLGKAYIFLTLVVISWDQTNDSAESIGGFVFYPNGSTSIQGTSWKFKKNCEGRR